MKLHETWDKLVKKCEWVQNNISTPIQVSVVVILFVGVICGLPSIIKSCNAKPNYETMNANFIGEEVALHGENFLIKVLSASTVDKITIKESKTSKTLSELEGHFIAVTISIKQDPNSKRTHSLDRNDFKLKDHTGTLIPTSYILGLIDVTAPDIYADKGDRIDSNISFSTQKPIKDYTWIGTEINSDSETVITVYFEIAANIFVENAIMIFEADFYTGSNGIKSATDVVLFHRKQPIIQ